MSARGSGQERRTQNVGWLPVTDFSKLERPLPGSARKRQGAVRYAPSFTGPALPRRKSQIKENNRASKCLFRGVFLLASARCASVSSDIEERRPADGNDCEVRRQDDADQNRMGRRRERTVGSGDLDRFFPAAAFGVERWADRGGNGDNYGWKAGCGHQGNRRSGGPQRSGRNGTQRRRGKGLRCGNRPTAESAPDGFLERNSGYRTERDAGELRDAGLQLVREGRESNNS